MATSKVRLGKHSSPCSLTWVRVRVRLRLRLRVRVRLRLRLRLGLGLMRGSDALSASSARSPG